jgi:hypothetical protein
VPCWYELGVSVGSMSRSLSHNLSLMLLPGRRCRLRSYYRGRRMMIQGGSCLKECVLSGWLTTVVCDSGLQTRNKAPFHKMTETNFYVKSSKGSNLVATVPLSTNDLFVVVAYFTSSAGEAASVAQSTKYRQLQAYRCQ